MTYYDTGPVILYSSQVHLSFFREDSYVQALCCIPFLDLDLCRNTLEFHPWFHGIVLFVVGSDAINQLVDIQRVADYMTSLL